MPAGPGPADEKGIKGLALSGIAGDLGMGSYRSAEERILDVVVRHAATVQRETLADVRKAVTSPELLAEAYERCGEVCAEYAKTFYLGADPDPCAFFLALKLLTFCALVLQEPS